MARAGGAGTAPIDPREGRSLRVMGDSQGHVRESNENGKASGQILRDGVRSEGDGRGEAADKHPFQRSAVHHKWRADVGVQIHKRPRPTTVDEQKMGGLLCGNVPVPDHFRKKDVWQRSLPVDLEEDRRKSHPKPRMVL
jgi:hypothetical protein